MILQFNEEVVNSGEYSRYNFEHPRFIGYLNKHGDILDYSRPLGIGGHDDNRLTTYFEYYFRMPTNDPWIQQIECKDVIDIEDEEWFGQERREYFEERLKHILDLKRKYGVKENPYDIFQEDLDIFFYNCYEADTFMDGFGQNCMALNKNEFYQKFCKYSKLYQRKINETEEQYRERHNQLFEYDYYWYLKHLMLDWYKTVIVQYMHYHLIERCKKGITTSDLTPNETFYNYLLNGFTIHQIPRMMYDNIKKMYVPYEHSKFLVTDRELRLQEEIQAIRKLVSKNELYKYYR